MQREIASERPVRSFGSGHQGDGNIDVAVRTCGPVARLPKSQSCRTLPFARAHARKPRNHSSLMAVRLLNGIRHRLMQLAGKVTTRWRSRVQTRPTRTDEQFAFALIISFSRADK